MARYNIRFANFATRSALFELQVELVTTVGALKAMAEEHLSNSDDLCPMKYFDKWFLDGQVGSRKRMMGIDEGDEGLTLDAAGLEDESFVYLEGPMFEEGQTEVGRAIAAVRAQAKAQAAQHALQVQWLMAAMGRRFDAMSDKQQEQSEVGHLMRTPLKALWEVLIDKANPGIDLPMAIIRDRRCGIERRAVLTDGPMKGGKGFIINTKDQEGATPLIMAVLAGRNDVLSALLSNGADYEATFGVCINTALDVAAITNNVGAIELLASYGADASKPYKFKYTALHQAAYNGHAAAIEALVRLGADLKKS